MKVALIVLYFGKLPNYFSLFLKSCEVNKDFTWLIFTDDQTKFNYPENVKKIDMKFEQCQNLFQQKFDFDIALKTPQKLCDYKCAYGYILQDYIKDYEFWGHCDIDLIFGNLSNFVTKEVLQNYDKLYTLGHLTIYRNYKLINRQFMNEINGQYRYKQVFTDDNGCGFDEWIGENINNIFYNTEYRFLDTAIGADLDPYNTSFVLAWYDKQNQRYIRDKVKNNVFEWKNGNLYRFYENEEKNKIIKEEFPYVHFQKRNMNFNKKILDVDDFFVIPNRFISENKDVKSMLDIAKKLSVINYQYFKVKYKSLKSRLKNKNFNFSNVFK